ncbi:VRR-NUC domain-containing protein [Trinickia symbiotica]|uniref:VRR-NUC domain-containing protein n=2 Tax=Trinickia symbiotica TaxID=863227 RepID=A0A2T3XW43_9BURK|nr:VRR-NUC domain-containing protein [Trinickia symbiotica]
MVQVATTCTTVNEQKTYAELPPRTKGYLQEKIEYALNAPDIVDIRLPDGSNTIALLKQLVMTLAIRVDERLAKYYWQYKAEVTFDMWPDFESGGTKAPIPFLSGKVEDGPGRRHSLNPFPPGRRAGYLRRPDVIIVKSPADHWPGRSLVDHQGYPHVDNSLRLVEVKFPGDAWGTGQERAYQKIAGNPGEYMRRMTVIDVSDCNGKLENARARALAMSPEERANEREKRLRAPIRSVEPIPQPAWYEDWVSRAEKASQEVSAAVAPIWDMLHDGICYVSGEVRAWLQNHAPWVMTAGKWVADAAGETWAWVDEEGHEIYRYTTAQLKAGWEAIVQATDITWEVLKQVDWTQIGTSIIKGLVAVVVVVAGAVVAFVLAEALVAILLTLAAIIATASTVAVTALAAALGVSATVGLASAT